MSKVGEHKSISRTILIILIIFSLAISFTAAYVTILQEENPTEKEGSAKVGIYIEPSQLNQGKVGIMIEEQNKGEVEING